MSTYQLEIDGSGAETGAARIVKSFNDIKAAADKMEGGVVKSANAASAAMAKLQAAAKPVSSAAIDSLKQLSGALSGFKGPSAAAARNTIAFLDGIRKIGTLNVGGRGLAALLGPLAGFRGPSATAGRNTASLLNALNRAASFSVPRGMTSLMNALSGFRGPSIAAGRNTLALLNAIKTFTPPAGINTTARAFIALAAAAERASASVGRLRSLAAGSTTINVNTRQASAGIQGLTRDHGLLQNAIVRTGTAMNALGGILGARFIINAANDVVKISSQLEAATQTSYQAKNEFGYLREMTKLLGLDFRETARSYGFFLASIQGTNMTVNEAREVFQGFATAARALQLSASDVDGVFRALGQIMSKGKLQAEELRGQLGDRLPGAFVRFARALNMTKPGELDAALKKGAISGKILEDAIKKVSRTLEDDFAASALKAANTVDAAFNRVKNAFMFAASDLGKSGLNEALINGANALTAFIESAAMDQALRGLGATFKFLGNNIEFFATLLSAFAMVSVGKFILGLVNLTKVIATVRIAMMGMTAISAAMGLGMIGAAGAVGRLTQAVRILFFLISRHPIGIAILAITALALAMSKSRDRTKEAVNELVQAGEQSAITANATAAFTATIADNSAKLGEGNNALRERIRLMSIQAAMTMGEGIGIKVTKGAITGERMVERQPILGFIKRAPIKSKVYDPNAEVFRGPDGKPITSKPLIDFLKRTGRTENGVYRPWSITPNDRPEIQARQYRGQVRAQGELGYMMDTPGVLNDEDRATAQTLLQSRGGALDRIALGARSGVYKFDPDAEFKKVFPKYDTGSTSPVISGDAVEAAKKEKKPKKPKGDGGEAEQFQNDIRRALEGYRDLNREIAASGSALNSFLSGNLDIIGVEAAAAAKTRIDSIMDTFKDPQKGITAIAQGMKASKVMDPNVDISTWEKARDAVEAVTKALEENNLRSKKDAEVGRGIAELRQENTSREKLLETMKQGALARADAVIALEIEKALVGTSAGEYDRLYKAMQKQIIAREELNRAEASGAAIQDAMSKTRVNVAVSDHMIGGANESEVAYYREMYEFREALLQQGYHGAELQGRIDLQASVLHEAELFKRLGDEIEKVKQISIDQADAVVDGLRRGILEGEKFSDVMKGIFKDLKAIILDAVVFNPLKTFLTDTFTKVNGTDAFGGLKKQRDQIFEKSQDANKSGYGFSTLEENTKKNLEEAGYKMVATSVATSAAQQTNALIAAGAVDTGRIVAAIGSQTAAATGSAGAGQAVANGNVGGAMSAAGTSGLPTPTELGAPPATGAPVDQEGNIVVTGTSKTRSTKTEMPGAPARPGSIFEPFKKMFDFKANGGAFKDLGNSIKNIGTAGKGLSGVGKAIGPAMKAAGQAFAAYQLGSGVAKMLGLGRVGSSMAGGAAAGFSLGGPVGAAVGAALGLAKGLFFKPKIPSSYGSVNVGATGSAEGGKGQKFGKGDRKVGEGMASGAAKMFNQFAIEFDGSLKAGNYGTFGRREFKKKEGEQSFYSVTGAMKKGKPVGREGSDWIRGTESEVQAFALLNQIRRGQIAGLSPTMQTVANNTKSKTMEDVEADFAVGKAYDEFIKSSFKLAQLATQVRDLNESARKLTAQSRALGLEESKIEKARGRMVKTLRDDFNFEINQGILGIENPMMQSYNQLVKDYRDTVENAMAVGGDLVAVEKYFGLKRAEIAKQEAEGTVSALQKTAQDMLTSLTAGSESPLNGGTIFANARDQFQGLKTQLAAGDLTNVDSLQSYAGNYLSAAQQVNGSSTAYFDIFREVTDFLKEMSAAQTSTAGSNVVEVPALPSIDSLVAEINAKNQEMLDATNNVGAAIVETGSQTVEAIQGLGGIFGNLLEQILNGQTKPAAVPSSNTGTSGVSDTGTVGHGGQVRTIGTTNQLV